MYYENTIVPISAVVMHELSTLVGEERMHCDRNQLRSLYLGLLSNCNQIFY